MHLESLLFTAAVDDADVDAIAITVSTRRVDMDVEADGKGVGVGVKRCGSVDVAGSVVIKQRLVDIVSYSATSKVL